MTQREFLTLYIIRICFVRSFVVSFFFLHSLSAFWFIWHHLESIKIDLNFKIKFKLAIDLIESNHTFQSQSQQINNVVGVAVSVATATATATALLIINKTAKQISFFLWLSSTFFLIDIFISYS